MANGKHSDYARTRGICIVEKGEIVLVRYIPLAVSATANPATKKKAWEEKTKKKKRKKERNKKNKKKGIPVRPAGIN